MVDEGGKREVTEEQAREFAKSVGAEAYFDTSAKTGQNVMAVFDRIVDKLEKLKPLMLQQQQQLRQNNRNTDTVKVNSNNDNNQAKKGGCCG